MRVISKRTLREFWERHPDAEVPLLAWWRRLVHTDPTELDTPAKVKSRYPYVSILGDDRVVFNIKGNNYRLIVRMNYRRGTAYVRFVGTHAEYDRVNAMEV